MVTGQFSSGRSLNFDHYGNRVYSPHDLVMILYEAWVRDELRWFQQGNRYRGKGTIRQTTVEEYAPLAFCKASMKYLRIYGGFLADIEIHLIISGIIKPGPTIEGAKYDSR